MNLVINSQFKPFSYQEMLAPVLMATQAHQELETQFNVLDTEASKWERLANSAIDADTYQVYKSYADDLRNKANILYSEGLTPNSRRDLLNMKARYNQDILPINEAYLKRQNLAKAQLDTLSRDNTALFDRRAQDIKLSELIANPDASYNTFSGSLLTKQSAQMASNLAKELMSGEDANTWKAILGGQYYSKAMRTGISSTELMNFLAGNKDNPIVNQKLQQIKDATLKSSGILDWGNYPTIEEKVDDYINQGLYSAIGTTQFKELENWMAKLKAQENSRRTPPPNNPPTDPYRLMQPVQRVAADGKTPTVRLQSLMKDINSFEGKHIKASEDGSGASFKGNIDANASYGIAGLFGFNAGDSRYKNARTQLESLRDKVQALKGIGNELGIDIDVKYSVNPSTGEISIDKSYEEQVRKAIKKSGSYDSDYFINMTSASPMIKGIIDYNNTASPGGDTSIFREYKGLGKKGDYLDIDSDEVNAILGKDGIGGSTTIYYDSKMNEFILSTNNKEGQNSKVVVDLSGLPGAGMVKESMKSLKESYKSGDITDDQFNYYMEQAGRALYTEIVGTQFQVPSTTSDKAVGRAYGDVY